jgi:protein FAM50
MGSRAEDLTKQRRQMLEQFEKQKEELVSQTERARPSANRFVGQNDSMEESLKKSTVGLVRLEDFQAMKKEIQEAKAREAAKTNELLCVFSFYLSSYSVVFYTTVRLHVVVFV